MSSKPKKQETKAYTYFHGSKFVFRVEMNSKSIWSKYMRMSKPTGYPKKLDYDVKFFNLF